MTNAEIESCIQTLRFLENTFLDDHGIFLNDKHPDNIEKIIKFLHESPCENCVSRDAVEKITWEEPSYDDALNVLTEVRDKVRALPSVKPHPVFFPPCEDCNDKMAEVRKAYDKIKKEWEWERNTYGQLVCGHCKAVQVQTYKSMYCPDCGARMKRGGKNE